MSNSKKREIKHRGVGGSGLGEEVSEQLRQQEKEGNEPLHNGYMRDGATLEDKESPKEKGSE